MHNFVFKWEQRFSVSSWPQNCKHCFASSKALISINKSFNIMLISLFQKTSNCQSSIIGCFSSFFLKFWRHNCWFNKIQSFKPISVFLCFDKNFCIKIRPILKARYMSPFTLFLSYLWGIWDFEKSGNFPGFWNTFVVTEPSE